MIRARRSSREISPEITYKGVNGGVKEGALLAEAGARYGCQQWSQYASRRRVGEYISSGINF